MPAWPAWAIAPSTTARPPRRSVKASFTVAASSSLNENTVPSGGLCLPGLPLSRHLAWDWRSRVRAGGRSIKTVRVIAARVS
jgi:hypothetical protein